MLQQKDTAGWETGSKIFVVLNSSSPSDVNITMPMIWSIYSFAHVTSVRLCCHSPTRLPSTSVPSCSKPSQYLKSITCPCTSTDPPDSCQPTAHPLAHTKYAHPLTDTQILMILWSYPVSVAHLFARLISAYHPTPAGPSARPSIHLSN